MANFEETVRSNYIKVNDVEKFKEFCKKMNVNHIEKDGIHGFTANAIPDFIYDEEDEECEIDFLNEIIEHISEDEVLIIMSSGYEKFRYVTGWAIAINSKGEERNISIDHIYTMAKELTKENKEITIASY